MRLSKRNMHSSSRLVLMIVMLGLAGCEFHGLTCWNRLKYLHSEIELELDEFGEADETELAQIRAAIAENVESCRGSSFYEDLSSDEGAGFEVIFTLLDFAIMANDVELTAEMYERQTTELSPEFRREELISGDMHLMTAIHFESDAVVRWLLENGYDANETYDMGWTPIFGVAAGTDGGLRAIRDLVAFGAELEWEGPDGITPLLTARRQGDLRKAQCLVSLGAQVPESLPAMEESPSVFVDPHEVEQITAFLSDIDREIPDHIESICTIDGHPSQEEAQ